MANTGGKRRSQKLGLRLQTTAVAGMHNSFRNEALTATVADAEFILV